MAGNNSSHDDILIIQKTYNFYLRLNKVVSTISKKDRYTVGVKAEYSTLEIIEKFYLANSKIGNERLQILKSADITLKILQLLLKALFDTKAVNENVYISLSESLIEIGKMLGGWIKTC